MMSLKNEPKDDHKMTIKKDAQNADNEGKVSVDNDHKMSLKMILIMSLKS